MSPTRDKESHNTNPVGSAIYCQKYTSTDCFFSDFAHREPNLW